MTEEIPIEYRVILIHPASRKVCALEKRDGYRLIRVDVPPRMRLAQQLQKAIRSAWGLTVMILDSLSSDDSTSPCAVAELLHGELPAGLKAIALEQIASDELSGQEHALLQAMLGGDARNPFARIGWIDDAIAWLESLTGRRISSKANLDHYNASGAFTLVRFRMDSGSNYWLKATGEPNTHERPVASILSKLCGNYVPEVVAEMPAWNAWLMRGDGECITALPTTSSDAARLLDGMAVSLAQLQMKTAGTEQALLEAGAFDHRTPALRTEAEALFAYMDEAMSLQISTKVLRIETKRLRELRWIFEDACQHMDALGFPDTVLHGDMNLCNILVADGRCVFIDWCEAYVGNPLITFEHLLLLNSIEPPCQKAACDRRLRETYRTAMSRICHSKMIDAGFAYAPLIAAVSAIFGRGDWLRTPLRHDPRRQAYVRGIARHMDRAAREPALLAALAVRRNS